MTERVRMEAQYGAEPWDRQGTGSGVRIDGQHEASWESASFGGRELSGAGVHTYILCILLLCHFKVFPLNANLTDRSNMGRLSEFPAMY